MGSEEKEKKREGKGGEGKERERGNGTEKQIGEVIVLTCSVLLCSGQDEEDYELSWMQGANSEGERL